MELSTKLPADAGIGRSGSTSSTSSTNGGGSGGGGGGGSEGVRVVVGSLDVNIGVVLPAEELLGKLPTVSCHRASGHSWPSGKVHAACEGCSAAASFCNRGARTRSKLPLPPRRTAAVSRAPPPHLNRRTAPRRQGARIYQMYASRPLPAAAALQRRSCRRLRRMRRARGCATCTCTLWRTTQPRARCMRAWGSRWRRRRPSRRREGWGAREGRSSTKRLRGCKERGALGQPLELGRCSDPTVGVNVFKG